MSWQQSNKTAETEYSQLIEYISEFASVCEWQTRNFRIVSLKITVKVCVCVFGLYVTSIHTYKHSKKFQQSMSNNISEGKITRRRCCTRRLVVELVLLLSIWLSRNTIEKILKCKELSRSDTYLLIMRPSRVISLTLLLCCPHQPRNSGGKISKSTEGKTEFVLLGGGGGYGTKKRNATYHFYIMKRKSETFRWLNRKCIF